MKYQFKHMLDYQQVHMKMTADLKLATKYQITHKLSSAQITIVILYSIRKHHSKCLSNSPFSLFCRNYFVRGCTWYTAKYGLRATTGYYKLLIQPALFPF